MSDIDDKLLQLAFDLKVGHIGDMAFKDKIKALFPAQGFCADCKFEADNYCERGGSPVIRIGNSLSDITLTEFGCNLFEKKE